MKLSCVLRRFDRGEVFRCQYRGGVAALVTTALGPRAHNADAEDPRAALYVQPPLLRAVLRCVQASNSAISMAS